MHELLTDEQTRHLREALRGHELEAIVMLALSTGMRRDELLQLHWHEIDVEQCEVMVRNSKTRMDLRRVRFSEEVADVLKGHRLRQRAASSEAGTAGTPHDLVFPDQAGRALAAEDLVKRWYDFLADTSLLHLRFHDLRVAHWRMLRAQRHSANEGHDEVQR